MVYTQLVLDTRRQKASDLFPVKLRITYNRVQKYYLTGFKMTARDFEDVLKNPAPKRLLETRIQLESLEFKAKRVISSLQVFSFNLFEEHYFANSKAGTSIFKLYEQVISQKLRDEKISTAMNYRCSMNSLSCFLHG